MINFNSQINVCKIIGIFNAKQKKIMFFIYLSEYIFSYQKDKIM